MGGPQIHKKHKRRRARRDAALLKSKPLAPVVSIGRRRRGETGQSHRFKTACGMENEKEVVAVVDGCCKETLLEAIMTTNLETFCAMLKQNQSWVLNSSFILGVIGQSTLHVAVRANSLDIVHLILKAGANLNSKNRVGITPLMLAIAQGNVGIADSLVSAGASLTEIDFFGRSVLHFADLLQNRLKGISDKLSQFLIDRGALRAMAQCGVVVPRPPQSTVIHQDIPFLSNSEPSNMESLNCILE